MANINKFLSTLDIIYCESFEPIDYGYGNGCGGAYTHLCPNTFNGNGLMGADRYGKGDILKSGFGEGNANYSFNTVPNMFYNFNKVEDKGYGAPYIKD